MRFFILRIKRNKKNSIRFKKKLEKWGDVMFYYIYM